MVAAGIVEIDMCLTGAGEGVTGCEFEKGLLAKEIGAGCGCLLLL
jgi:hypothetical protein